MRVAAPADQAGSAVRRPALSLHNPGLPPAFALLRTPANPAEVAYFKPGDTCMSQVHYGAARGHIWVVCNSSGFYVLGLKPVVRAALLLSATARRRR